MTKKFEILCCENMAGEVAEVVAAGEFPGILVRTFRIGCGGRRVQWSSGIEALFNEMREVCDRICILRFGEKIDPPALSGAGPTVVAPDLMRDVLIPGPLFDAIIREGAFMVIPGILSRWKEHVEALGSGGGMPEGVFLEPVKKIVLIDTEVDSDSPRLLAGIGGELGIPTERIPIGTESLRRYIRLQYLQWRLDSESLRDAVAAGDRLFE